MTTKGDCVEICPYGTYQFIPNASCLEFCPNNYEINTEKTKCILKKYDETLTTFEFKQQIMNNISSYVDSSSVINGSDFIALILSSEDMNPEEQIEAGISAIDLGNCEKKKKKYYNIPSGENLIVLEMESKDSKDKNNLKDSFKLGKSITLEVYSINGNKSNEIYWRRRRD